MDSLRTIVRKVACLCDVARLVLELETVMLTKYETKSHRVKGMFFIHVQVPVSGSQEILWPHKYV